MEVASRLPAPADPAAVERLLEAQRLLCATCVSEEDCQQAVALLQELGAPLDDGGFDYFPALLTLASLSGTGLDPFIEQDKAKAARLYLRVLAHERSSTLDADLLEDAATQLCNIVREQKADFGQSEQAQLEELANGVAAGAVPFVRTWTRFAAHELARQLQEANEDPKDREKRLAREAARESFREEALGRQRQSTEAALARAEELQLEGNDLCRQGQLPGNAKGGILLTRALEHYGSAISVLSECLASGLHLVPEEANTVRRRRGTLQSNAAQVCLSRKDWQEARRLAKAAMEDDSENFKSWFRCARAEIELREWDAAAKTIDEALVKTRGRKGEEANANVLELWKLAEEVSKALPDFKWSSTKPLAPNAEDFEKRLVGFWEYQGGKYEIRIEQWGALIFHEETVKVDLMRKSKLSWRGEFEMVEGMSLVLNYEPGADMIQTQFIPPPDCPEESKWKGPTSFTAKRVPEPEPPPSEPVPVPAEEPAVAAPTRTPPQQPAPVVAPPAAPSVPDDAPRVLWLSGHDDLSGCYELLPETLQNDRPIYRRCLESEELFLWYRGGNWGVTKTLHASALVVPFLARCGDNSGLSCHPLDVRRPRWYVRRGRGQEDLDPAISLSATAPCASLGEGGYPAAASGRPVSASSEVVPVPSLVEDSAAESTPSAVTISGRQGLHEEVNGLYELSPSAGSGTPVYVHSERRLSLFYIKGYWVLAPELCAVPLSLARCPAPVGIRSPLGCSAAWEFLCGQNLQGAMVSLETRTYEKDAAVLLCAAAASKFGATEAEEALQEAGVRRNQMPPWVGDASTEICGNEVKAVVVVREGLSIALKTLWLDVGAETLKVGLPNEGTLSLPLPVAVDTEALPVAKLSEKTRTLRVRLSIRP